MLNDYSNILILFLIVGIGFILGKIKWFNENSNSAMTKLLLNITLPITLILSITTDFSKKEFLTLIPAIILPFSTILLLMLISFIVAIIMKIPRGEHGLFIGLCSMSSTVFFGIPITMAVYGSHQLPYALMTYIAQTIIYWTLGIYLLKNDNNTEKFNVIDTIKNIFTPPLIAFIIGVFLLLTHIKISSLLTSFFDYLNGMTSPLAMLIIGVIIYLTGLKTLKITIPIIVIIIFRFIVTPLVVLLLGHLLNMPIMMIKVTILVCSLPIPNTTVILANKYKADITLATQALTFSILTYLLYIPVILYFIHTI
ncbi:AEC family transporter [Providencia rettgeri]|uniref:AEC family transporter n=1 Tax=Providencia rettgeri TaxID=587 RepID=UPI002220BACA|nr:AEC family transporter [Providencia rettgeri]ELR5278771.1 AEC family transporter [Providencia rettgeri]UYV40748.1 AEC family transporter [Providencia rettgeri]